MLSKYPLKEIPKYIGRGLRINEILDLYCYGEHYGFGQIVQIEPAYIIVKFADNRSGKIAVDCIYINDLSWEACVARFDKYEHEELFEELTEIMNGYKPIAKRIIAAGWRPYKIDYDLQEKLDAE